jgi:hypothetical protein
MMRYSYLYPYAIIVLALLLGGWRTAIYTALVTILAELQMIHATLRGRLPPP